MNNRGQRPLKANDMYPSQQQPPVYYRLQANVPYMGVQHAGWLHTQPFMASMLQAFLQSCNGGMLRVVTQDGKPVAATAFPGMPAPNTQMPGLQIPGMQNPIAQNYQSSGWPQFG